MNKFLYFQDGHVSGKNPESRTDNFYQAWMAKFKEVLTIAKERKVDAIIDGGDLLDIPAVADSIVDDILDLIEATGIPVYSLWGNHALIGHHIETSNGTSLRHMFRRCKILKEAKDDIIGKNYVIKFVDYDHNIEARIKSDGINFTGTDDDRWKVAVVHAFVTPKPFLPTVLHVVCDDIQTNADLVLVAHYHAVWEKQVGKTKFLDIGCMGRRAISEKDIRPSCLLLDFSSPKGKKINHELIYLQSAKEGKDVFDLDAKELEASNERELELFVNSLRDFKNQELDVRGSIEYIGKEQNIDRKVIDRILTKLNEVQVK